MTGNLDVLMAMLNEEYPNADALHKFSDIGLDSLDYLSFSSRVEDQFSVDFPKDIVFKTPYEMLCWVNMKRPDAI